MNDPAHSEVQRLLQDGLDLYGRDRVDDAVTCWRQALALDPTNSEALDYLRTAGVETPEAEPEEEAPAAPSPASVGPSTDPLEGVETLVAAGRTTEALELLESLPAAHAARVELQAWQELLRVEAVARFRSALGDGSHALRQKVAANELMGFNLPSGAGFLLSMVDGVTPTDDLISVSGMDPFEALRMLHRLVDAGILEATP